ncbi:MAG: beta-phosphoglucomutase [Flavobacteriaceae bacterium]
MTTSKPTFIFDLDGVITKTEAHHFEAWKATGSFLDYLITPENNEKLKGVSRIDSLKKIIAWSGKEVSTEEFDRLLEEKNERYLASLSSLSEKDIMEGVHEFILDAKKNNHQIALYSSSKNAKLILTKLNIIDLFDVIVDGNDVVNSKPHPEGFELAAKLTGSSHKDCVVFEDSSSGILAANQIGMTTVGIGDVENLSMATTVITNFKEIDLNDFKL